MNTTPPTLLTPLPKNLSLAAQIALRYKDDPVGFCRDILNRAPLPWQAEFLSLIAKGERYISIRAGHGVGKTAACASVALWFLFCRYPQKTIVTAPSSRQLEGSFLPEVKSLIKRLPPQLQALLDVKTDRITLVADPDGSFLAAAVASNDRPESLAGIHSENVLLIVDEASGVPEQVYQNAQGSMSGEHACTVLIGNPTRNSGYFYKTHHDWKKTDEADETGWHTMHVSCETVGLVDEKFINKLLKDYGRDSNEYSIRVLGEFAKSDENTLIPASHVDEAFERDIQPDPNTPLVFGVDIARMGGDRTVICFRRGGVVEGFKSWRNKDLVEVTGIIAAEARQHKPAEICVDAVGMGAGVADNLRHMGFDVRAVNVSESSAMNPQANRLRDDLWMQLRDWLALRQCKLPSDVEGLREELVAPLYSYTPTDKLVVEKKTEMRRRMSRSPDLADALCLTFAGGAARVGGGASRWIKGKPLKRNIKGIV